MTEDKNPEQARLSEPLLDGTRARVSRQLPAALTMVTESYHRTWASLHETLDRRSRLLSKPLDARIEVNPHNEIEMSVVRKSGLSQHPIIGFVCHAKCEARSSTITGSGLT